MAKNWDITERFKLSNLTLFFIILLLVPGWFTWAIAYDPPGEVNHYSGISVAEGQFWSDEYSLRITSNVTFNLFSNPDIDVYLLLSHESIDPKAYRVQNAFTSSRLISRVLSNTTYNFEIGDTGDWTFSLWTLTKSSNSSISLEYTISYDNPSFSTTDQFYYLALFMSILLIVNFLAHNKQLRFFRLWVKAKLRDKDTPVDKDYDTSFGHEEMVGSIDKNSEKDDKISSVFGDKK